MKKAMAILSAFLMAFSVCTCAFAADAAADSAKVYVSVSDKGNIELAYYEVTVTDTDSDGALTVNDALYCAHETYYDGGAAAGYTAVTSSYGLSLVKLWGKENNFGFGYYVNNVSSWSLTDPVKDGDFVYAFSYVDTTGWSDAYAFFDKETADMTQYGTITLTLSDFAAFSTEASPVAGAEITVNGTKTGVYTDENGKATIEIDEAGETLISAVGADGTIITPPVCVATVKKAGIGETISHYFSIIVNAIKAFFTNILSK